MALSTRRSTYAAACKGKVCDATKAHPVLNLAGYKLAAFRCQNPRKLGRSNIPDVPSQVSWAELKAAAKERDLDDVEEAVRKFIKATPDVTYV
jgi:hypothetical protein